MLLAGDVLGRGHDSALLCAEEKETGGQKGKEGERPLGRGRGLSWGLVVGTKKRSQARRAGSSCGEGADKDEPAVRLRDWEHMGHLEGLGEGRQGKC